MNKAELIEKIAQKTDLTKSKSEDVLDAVLEVITDSVSKGQEVKLVGFGTFSRSERKARVGRNPTTGKSLKIPASKIPKFKPGKDFKASVNH